MRKKYLIVHLFAAFITLFTVMFIACNKQEHKSHQIEYEKINPTCQTPGYERYYCNNCSYEEIFNTTPPIPCNSYRHSTVKINNCITKIYNKCTWCDKIISSYNEENHDVVLQRELSGEPCYKCKKCDYINYIDKEYTHIKLSIKAPEVIDYYNEIKICRSHVGEVAVKFLNIIPKEYFLYDIVFYFEDKEIHYKDLNTAFEFKNSRRDWFERYTTCH